jgi:hypothetical protein
MTTTTSDDMALVERLRARADRHLARQILAPHGDAPLHLEAASTIERLTQVKQRDSVARNQPCGEVSADAEIVAGLEAEPSAAFTPERWYLDIGDHSYRYVHITDSDDQTVFYKHRSGTAKEADRDEVNGCLAAAAPELLAALRAMVLNDRHTYRDCHKAAVAAIAKALGQGEPGTTDRPAMPREVPAIPPETAIPEDKQSVSKGDEWITDDPPAALRWAIEFGLGDLREIASRLREQSADTASYLEHRADLLATIMKAAIPTSEASS